MICNREDCTGCFACYNVCPKKAIKMIEDDNGFIYPSIDKKKCVNCNLCKKVCPSINDVKLNEIIQCYALQRKNNKELIESSSGGAASLFIESFINNSGIVYSTSFENKFKINHIRIEKMDCLNGVRGSKYVHSYVNNTFLEAKNDLLKNKKVLFIGTPCQIAGLKKFLMKDYENLYTIDIICHGVPSQKYLKDELEEFFDINKINNIKFRYNNSFIISVNNNNFLSVNESPYYFGFMTGLIYRENCYSCKYANSKRCSDITIGDFWGLDSNSKLYEKRDQGISVLLLNSDKGTKLFDMIKDVSIYEERDILEAIKGNSQLRNPVKKPKRYERFKNDYIRYGFKKAFMKNYYIFYYKNKIKNTSFVLKILKLFRGK